MLETLFRHRMVAEAMAIKEAIMFKPNCPSSGAASMSSMFTIPVTVMEA